VFPTGFVFGVLVAAQIGPVSLLIVRTVLRGGRLVGLAMALAVALVDLLYAVVGLAGISHALSGGSVQLAFGLTSGAILIFIGMRTSWAGFRARIGLEGAVIEPRRAFVTAVAATALNPLTIALWTISFPAAAPKSASDSVANAVVLLAGVGLGSLTWYTAFTTVIAGVRHRLGNSILRAVDIVSGLALAGFGAFVAVRAAQES
jgi:putative LysE/RhtB family amino acid efflux pump